MPPMVARLDVEVSGPKSKERDCEAVRRLDRRLDISLVARDHDADRLDLVHGGVSGVEQPRILVEAHFPLDALFQIRLDLAVFLFPAGIHKHNLYIMRQ
ncbi:MAG: hypothetical protein HYS67_09230 [Deltaproteobacteria bacterium]|nr:hypothetical protein [Deltaproteobacteria bacterium]